MNYQIDDFSEYNVFYALAVKDIIEFDRAMSKLEFFYENFKDLRTSNNYHQLQAIIIEQNRRFLHKTGRFYRRIAEKPIHFLRYLAEWQLSSSI
jgi:hypothetical protein